MPNDLPNFDLPSYQFFWSLKKSTITFSFRSNEPSCNILGPLGQYDHPRKKKTKHTSVIFLLAKKNKNKIPHFYSYQLETPTVGFSDTLNLMM